MNSKRIVETGDKVYEYNLNNQYYPINIYDLTDNTEKIILQENKIEEIENEIIDINKEINYTNKELSYTLNGLKNFIYVPIALISGLLVTLLTGAVTYGNGFIWLCVGLSGSIGLFVSLLNYF